MTSDSRLSFARGVVVENMGSTVLVMIPGRQDVLTLTGRAAEVVTAVTKGSPVSTDLTVHVEQLVDAGVLIRPMSRRSLIRAGAIGAGAGIAVFAMPGVAAASSHGGSGGSGGDADWTISAGTETTSGQVTGFSLSVVDNSDNQTQIPDATPGTVQRGDRTIAVVWEADTRVGFEGRGEFVPLDDPLDPPIAPDAWYGVEWTLTFSIGGQQVVLPFTPEGAV